jgi:hypothetical protein
MKSLFKNRAMRIAGLILACVVSMSGCRQQPPEEFSQYFGSMTLGKGSIIYGHFKGQHQGVQGGQWVVICCDIAGSSSIGLGQGYQSSSDGRRLDWQTERTEGWNVRVRLNGKEYDTSKGALFLVKVEGDKTEVEQLATDLSAFQSDTRSIQEFVQKDAAVSKFLGIKTD